MIRTTNYSILAALLMLISAPATALEIPRGGPRDGRVKYINYNPSEVVRVVGHYGYSTHIQFAPGELIEHIAPGDKEAWDLAPVENHLFLKPVGDKAATNMTVVTNRRIYNFELFAHWSKKGTRPKDMYFQVNFRYPQEEAVNALLEADSRKLQDRIRNNQPVAVNWNYWARGSSDVTPNRAFDDARFTYLTFSNNRDMPAVYIVNPDGSESLVNTHINPKHSDTVVVHKVSQRLVLRKGASVACIYNKSFDKDGISNTTGTTIYGVERVVKGEENGS